MAKGIFDWQASKNISRLGVKTMTEKTFSLNYETIAQLFENGVCLTYNPTEPTPAWQYAKQLETDFKKQNGVNRCRIISKTAKLWQRSYHPTFHYFSDGSLIYSRYLQDKGAMKMLQRIKKLLKIRGYKVSKIYAPLNEIDFFDYDKMLRHISEQACQHYPYTDDLSAAPFPSKEEFVQECFAGGNILLTACKDENITPESRDYLALFADGRFFVAETYEKAVANFSKITKFEYENTDSLRLQTEYVPQGYIDALYEKAAEFEWYETPEAAAQKQKPDDASLQKMQQYIADLFKNRKCVSVLNPEVKGMFSPDLGKYALFNDGRLLIAQSRKNFGDDCLFMQQMHQAYPDYKFTIEQIPDDYFSEIYRKLPEYQKGATVIYLEMLKQKARKLKRMLEIAHHEALDMAAQIVGWPNWKAVKIEDEAHARNLIGHLNWRHQSALEHNPENPLMWEYEYWKMLQKHPH